MLLFANPVGFRGIEEATIKASQKVAETSY
jgi:hypothetical protein